MLNDSEKDQNVWRDFIRKLAEHPNLERCSLEYNNGSFPKMHYVQARAAASMAIKKINGMLDIDLSKDLVFLSELIVCNSDMLKEIVEVCGIRSIKVSSILKKQDYHLVNYDKLLKFFNDIA